MAISIILHEIKHIWWKYNKQESILRVRFTTRPATFDGICFLWCQTSNLGSTTTTWRWRSTRPTWPKGPCFSLFLTETDELAIGVDSTRHRAVACQRTAAENLSQRVTETVCRISKCRSLRGGLAESVIIALLSGTLLKFSPARLLCCANSNGAALIKENVHAGWVFHRALVWRRVELKYGNYRTTVAFNFNCREIVSTFFPPPTKTDSFMNINLGLVIQQTFSR